MKIFLKIVKIIKRIFMLAVYLISFCTVRKKKLWVFGAWVGQLYADNTKALFEYVNKEHKDIKCVWISRNKNVVKQVRSLGYRAYYYLSFKGIIYSLHSSCFFATEGDMDYPAFCAGNAPVIQLWHGMGIKEVGLNSGWQKIWQEKKSKHYLLDKLSLKINKYDISYHYKWIWMAASEEAKKKYAKSFYVPEENFYITGQPKDDTFVNIKNSEYINELREKHPNTKIAVYLPTHRNFGKSEVISDVMSIETLKKVNQQLAEKNIVMIFKPHFHEFKKYEGYEGELSNIIFATDKEKFGDVYEFLPCCDILITDYSGIMFGYLASGKPIVYFTYDYDEYVNGDAGFCYDFNDITYGPVCKTWDEVVEGVTTIKAEDYAEVREKQRARFCPFNDGKNCERVYNRVLEILNIKD